MLKRALLAFCMAGLIHLSVVSFAAAQMVRFDGHRVARVAVSSEQQRDLLESLTDDVWSENPYAGTIDARFSPTQYDSLIQSGLPYTVMIKDLQVLIEAERDAHGIAGRGTWDAYMDNDEVLAYLDSLVALRPDLVETFVLGQTIQGRDITGIKITGAGGGTKPGIYYESCIHAREWITVPVILYLAEHLVSNYDSDAYIRELVDRCEWYIVPVVNVDGYIHSWESNRMWRKNRRNNGGGHWGVDLNRNWSVGWGGGGSSGNPSEDTYRGTAPFSEPETDAVRDFINAHPNILAFHDIHSYSQLLLWPWGYKSQLPPDQAAFAQLGEHMVELVEAVHGLRYREGPCYSTIYQASGVSVDWAYGSAGLLGFTFELRDTGNYGFLLPADQILPNCEEILPALLYQADFCSQPVMIVFPDEWPEYVERDGSTTLRIEVDPAAEGVDNDEVTLYLRVGDSGPFETYPIAHVSGNEFEATFPARACGGVTQYYVAAIGDGGTPTVNPLDAPQSFYTAYVGTPEVMFFDNMETNLGWTVGEPDDDATTGIWNRMDPEGTTAQPEVDHTHMGTDCWVTDGYAGYAASVYDVDGGKTTLLSPTFDLSGYVDAVVTYWCWYSNDTGANPNADVFEIDVSADGGDSWVNADTVGPGGDEASGEWHRREFHLADAITPTANVIIRFVASDYDGGSIVEAAIDDLELEAVSCVDLLGDMNCDGNVNGFDIDPFILVVGDQLSEYYSLNPGCNHLLGDITGDGNVNGFDIDGFIDLVGS